MNEMTSMPTDRSSRASMCSRENIPIRSTPELRHENLSRLLRMGHVASTGMQSLLDASVAESNLMVTQTAGLLELTVGIAFFLDTTFGSSNPELGAIRRRVLMHNDGSTLRTIGCGYSVDDIAGMSFVT